MRKQLYVKLNRGEIVYRFVFLIFMLLFGVPRLSAQTCSPNYNNPWQWGPHATWFFGDGVFLNFPNGTGSPTVTYKTVNNNTYRSYEGTAAINDNAGNLIAFSNGRGLWDASGATISTGLLAGNENGAVGARSSAVQGIVVIRHPFNPNKIYILTSDDALTTTDMGVNYSVYDIVSNTMTTPQRLRDNNGQYYRTTEQIDATFHTNGFDVWIVVRQSGNGNQANFRNFFSYKLTCSGLDTVPVKSVAGPPVKGNWAQNWERGALKFSWNGKKAISVNHVNDWASYDEAIVVYDFNQTTGQLTNTKTVAGKWGGGTWSGNTYESMYDCEWAPDNKGVYVVPAGGVARLLWLNASFSTADSIYNSIKVVTNSISVPGDLKLGGDGKLYQATFSNALKVISFANASDLNTGSNPTIGSLALNQNSQLGLSNMFIPPIDYLKIQPAPKMSCSDSPKDLAVNWFCKGTSAEDTVANPLGWTASCGACIVDSKKGIFDPSISGDGTFKVFYSYGMNCSIVDSMTIVVDTCNNCKDTTLVNLILPVCNSLDSIDLKTFQVTNKPGVWSITSKPLGSTATVSATNHLILNNTVNGNYEITYHVLNQDPTCGNNPKRVLKIVSTSVDLGPDKELCFANGEKYSTALNISGGKYLWSTNSTDSFIVVTQKGKIWVSVLDKNNCAASDTLNLMEDCPVELCMPNVFTPNGDGHNDYLQPCKDIYKHISDVPYVMEHLNSINFVVYDRWGIKMFESEGVFPMWDGKFKGNEASSGVYYWIFHYEEKTSGVHEYTGFAHLIR